MTKIANMETELAELKEAAQEETVVILTEKQIRKIANSVLSQIANNIMEYVSDFDFKIKHKEIELDSLDLNENEMLNEIISNITESVQEIAEEMSEVDN
jgi:cobalamin biosynthesis protein CbiD